MSNMKVLTFGAGALGTYLGGSLALAGEHVVFLEQPALVDQLRHRGLRLDLTIDRRRPGSEAKTVSPASVIFADSLQEALRYGPFDAALYALKSYDTPAALEAIRPFAERMPPLVCFSNGVDNEPALAEVLGPAKVVPGTVSTAIGRRAAGDIVLERLRGIGVATAHPLSRSLIAASNAAYLRAHPYANAAAMKWSKLLTNLIANPTSAILDMTAAEVFANPRLYALEIGMLRECLAVMRAQGLPVVDLPGTPVRALAFAVQLPVWLSKPLLAGAAGAGRGDKMPSLHIDLHSGRGKSEVEYLHGAVVRAGRRFGVRTPINALLTDTLMDLTRGTTPLSKYSHQPAKLLAALRPPARLP
jgi:2-dehydropantoate 2-reductase